MKTLEIHIESDKRNSEEMPKRMRTGRVLKSILIIFMLSWVTILSSCAVAVRTPRYHDRSDVVIGDNDHDNRYNRRERHHRRDRLDRNNRHNRHDRDDHDNAIIIR
jgi:hypothetical protein